MKLYHIDRNKNLECGMLNLKKTVVLDGGEAVQNILDNNIKCYYYEGLSIHGVNYFVRPIASTDAVIETVFEYERLLNYPDKLSRFQSLFAFDEANLKKFIEEYRLTDFKLFEVESEYFEKYNQRLLHGDRQFHLSELAKDYWSNQNRYNIAIDNPIYEHLLKFPINIIGEVKISEMN